jgi:hypothetical protein
MADTQYAVDPWLADVVDNVVATELDGPNPPAEYADLSQGQQEVYRQQFIEALYKDDVLNGFCRGKREAYLQNLITKCRPLLPLITDAKFSKMANEVVGSTPTELPGPRLQKVSVGATKLYRYLQLLQRENEPKAKVQKEVEVGAQKSRTQMQQYVADAAKLTNIDYAALLGRRILKYQVALAQGTPSSISVAQNLWREMRGSLAGWLAGTETVGQGITPTAFIKQQQGTTPTSTALHAFAANGYSIVVKDQTQIHPDWTKEMPAVLKDWRPEWPLKPLTEPGESLVDDKGVQGAAAPAEVAEWLYDARVGRLDLQTFLDVYPPADQPLAAHEVFVSTSPSTWALESSNPNRPQFDRMVAGRNFFTGPLSQRAKAVEEQMELYNSAQKKLKEDEKPQDPLIYIKLDCVENSREFLNKKVQSEGETWNAITSKTSPRDPWIPLNVISAFVSYKCQLPWPDWSTFYLHPNGVDLSGARSWYQVPYEDSLESWQREDLSPETVGDTIRNREGTVPFNYYDPMASKVIGVWLPNLIWASPYTLTRITNFSPWRLEVVHLGPKAEFAYRTFDWFPHPLQRGETLADVVEAYKLPAETTDEFVATLKAHNTLAEVAEFFDGTADTAKLNAMADLNYEIAVPRIVPMYLLLRSGEANTIPQKSMTPDGNIIIVTDVEADTIGEDTQISFNHIPARQLTKLRQGISPISRLFLFYLNNDYRVFTQGLANILFHTPTLFKALTGDTFTSISPPRTTAQFNRYGDENDDWIAPGDWDAALEFDEYVDKFRRLYRTPWAASQYVNLDKEVPLDELEQADADQDGYEGTVNPAFIPQEGTVATRIFHHRPYEIGQGFIARITRRTIPKTEGSRLSSIERGAGVPEPDSRLIALGKELKKSFQQQRIALFHELAEKAFIGWLEEEGITGTLRKEYQNSITEAYNTAWSGFFTPERVPEKKEQLGKFAPANKYNAAARFGSRSDLGLDPLTNKPYPYAVSDLVARWNPRAVRRDKDEKFLYPYQSDAVLRLIDNNGGLLAFDVGVGKTIAALAAVGMLKQQGKATRSVFLVPKSIKLKWWKDMQENLPDWRVAVFGKKIGYPTKKKELPEDRKGAYDRIRKAVEKTIDKKEWDEDEQAARKEEARKIAIYTTIGVYKNMEQVLAKVYGKDVPTAVVKKLGGIDAVDKTFSTVDPSWVDENATNSVAKLQKFRDGFYDCLLLDEYDFKKIGIQREKALTHFVNASPMFAYLFRNGFSTGRNALNKPTKGVNERLGIAAKYVGLSAANYTQPNPLKPTELLVHRFADNPELLYKAYADFLFKTNNGASQQLWPWVGPTIPGDTFPFLPTVIGYLERTIQELGGDAGSALWGSIADLFFERNLTLPRTSIHLNARDYYLGILGASEDKSLRVPAGARVVYANPRNSEEKKSSHVAAHFAKSANIAQLALVNAAIELYMDATFGVGTAQVSPTHYRFQDFYPNLILTTNPGRYPDGAVVENYFNYGVMLYDVTLPGGHEVREPSLFPRPAGQDVFQPVIQTPAQSASSVAQIVVDTINQNPGSYGLTGPVKVGLDWKRYPSPISGSPVKDDSTRIGFANQFAKLISPYLSQSKENPDIPPRITWEDLKVDNFVIDEAHKFKGLFEPASRGGEVKYLASGGTSTQAWLMEYMTHTVKARGGQIMLLTATPAKQSPVDFYNIVQLLGARGIGKDQNLYNLFNINTAEQFISRFVCIQERVVVDSNYEAKRSPAATMFGPFDNLLSEFTQIFKRYSDRKTVADAPYLRGETAASTQSKQYSPVQRAKNKQTWEDGSWQQGTDVLTTYGPSLVEAFAKEVKRTTKKELVYDPTTKVSGLPRARLRVSRGDDTGDFRIVNYASEPTEEKGRFRNTITVLPCFSGSAAGPDKQPWSVFINTKVPVPIVLKPVVKMQKSQKNLYEDYQRALGAMLTAGTNVSSVTAKIGDREGVKVLRKTIFNILTRLALHPALQTYANVFTVEIEEDLPEDDDVEEETDATLEAEKLKSSAAQGFTDGLVMSYNYPIDPNVFAKDAVGRAIRRIQGFVGTSKDKVSEPGKLGWEGTVTLRNPPYHQLIEIYRELHSSFSTEKARAADEATQNGLEGEALTEAIDKAVATWCKTNIDLDYSTVAGVDTIEVPTGEVDAKGKEKFTTEQTPGVITQGVAYSKVKQALNSSLKKSERQEAVPGLWNYEDDAPFTKDAIKTTRSTSASRAFNSAGRPIPDLHRLNPIAARTLAIADTIVGQQVYDVKNPYRGGVTCGNIIFVNNLLYQAMQLMTLCRVNALAKAAEYELAAYAKYLGGSVPSEDELTEILEWYGLGAEGWTMPFTARALINTTFPTANIANLGTGNTYPGDPNDPGLHDTCKEVRKVLVAINAAAFGDAGGTYAEGNPGTTPLEYTGKRYSKPNLHPHCWYWLAGIPKEGVPTATDRWLKYRVDESALRLTYYRAWVDEGKSVCVMNAASSPSNVREDLAQLFNGEYEPVEGAGETTFKAIRPPRFDVVLANNVAYEGIDLQTRTCRIIHADLPYTPSDIIQRNGRAVRQGNLYEEAEIHAVLTEDTVDYYRIQTIERKRGWLDSALDEGKASYELSNDERELLELATKAVLPSQRAGVEEKVKARLEAIEAEERQRAFTPIINQLGIAAQKQRTMNITSAASPEEYKNQIAANGKAKRDALKMANKPTGGCG